MRPSCCIVTELAKHGNLFDYIHNKVQCNYFAFVGVIYFLRTKFGFCI